MLSFMHSDLLQQSYSYEADYRREYRPSLQHEQHILDYTIFLCILVDTFVLTTVVSLFYFPEDVSIFQNTILLILFTLFIGRQFGEFLWQLSQHYEFVNSRKQFTVRSYEHSNIEYICELVWNNPDSVFDFRTHPVRVGQRFISPHFMLAPMETQVIQQPTHRYNTRLQAHNLRLSAQAT